ncbi:MAG: hypothetical protein IT320_23390 [Anaerolineae bacterium]|nr:hypothetical protein [Anaerolineae bacterium]
MKWLSQLLRLIREHAVAALIGGVIGIVVTLLSTAESATSQLSYAVLIVTTALLLLALMSAAALETQIRESQLHTGELEHLIKLAQIPFNTQYFSPDDRKAVFELLKSRAREARESILVVNYFSGLEADDTDIPTPDDSAEHNTEQKRGVELQERRADYYDFLLDLPEDVKYTRIIQFDTFDLAASEPKIRQIVHNKAYREHFQKLHLLAHRARERKNVPEIRIMKRRIPMTYTLIDRQFLMIQIEQPDKDRPVTRMWGIIIINNLDPNLADQFDSVLEEGQWRHPVDDDFNEPTNQTAQ